jgi:biotin carboxylase
VSKRLLLFAATTGYQIRTFADAARRVGAELTLATDRCHIMDDPWNDRAIPVKFDRIVESLDGLRTLKFNGVAAVGDRPALLAAEAASALGIPFHSREAALAGLDKHFARKLYQAAGLRVPQFFQISGEDDAMRAPYPCVLKPIDLSASRGVIRANNQDEFRGALARIRKIGARAIQVEDYIPGREFAIEGIVTHGRFQAFAIFDKPDPLEGPFFEETIYVTPSREPDAVQQALLDTTAAAVRAVGLYHGPVHAELRYNAAGAWILETHARPIGGLCARAVQFQDGVPLEEIILRHALGEDIAAASGPGASGVMMIPIPKAGLYESVEGFDRATTIPGIEDVIITAAEGQRLIPLPEGASYLGFIFARAETPAEVEDALRRSHAELRFRIATTLPTFSSSP